jgi:hypothetical protein
MAVKIIKVLRARPVVDWSALDTCLESEGVLAGDDCVNGKSGSMQCGITSQ